MSVARASIESRQRERRILLLVHYSDSNYGNHLVNFAARHLLEALGATVDVVVPVGGEAGARRLRIGNIPLKAVRLVRSGAIFSRIASRVRAWSSRSSVHHEDGAISQVQEARLRSFAGFSSSWVRPRWVPVEGLSQARAAYTHCAVGGDQIWNFDYGIGGWKFADFFEPGCVVFLAPSVGHRVLPLEWRRHYRRWLARFAEVSTRESEWADGLFARDRGPVFTQVIDSTLALPRSAWEELAGPREPVSKRYLLLYELGGLAPDERAKIDAIASANNLQIRELSDRVGGTDWAGGPQSFLRLIADASCVVTDSYHGCIFSIHFERPLIVARRRGFASAMNTRIDRLLDQFGLQDRVLNDVDVSRAVVPRGHADRVETGRLELFEYLTRAGLTDGVDYEAWKTRLGAIQ